MSEEVKVVLSPAAHYLLRAEIASRALQGVLAAHAAEGVSLPGRGQAADLAVGYADALIERLNQPAAAPAALGVAPDDRLRLAAARLAGVVRDRFTGLEMVALMPVPGELRAAVEDVESLVGGN